MTNLSDIITPTNILTSGGALGTPSSGTLTNATGLPAAGVVGTAAVLGANTFTGLQTFKAGADIASATAVDLTAATGNTVVITGTTTSTSLTMTAGQQMLLLPSGAWPLTYHATTMNINGGVDYTCAAGDRVYAAKDLAGVIRVSIIKQDGTAVVAASAGVGDHAVVLWSGNGFGSTNTKIRRYTTSHINVGTDITYADSSTLGATFTVNTTGVYFIEVSEFHSAQTTFGCSVNSSQLTTSIDAITAADIMVYAITANNIPVGISMCAYLTASDVVRSHGAGATTNTTAYQSNFAIRRIG